MKTNILNIILLFIGFNQIGCIVTAPPTVYTDPPYHTSSCNKVKESQFSFMSFSSNGTGSSLGFRFSHLYNSNLIFGVQTFWASRPMVMYGDNVISDTDSVDNAISYHEIAFGYDHLLNRYINMTFFGGLGVGSLKAQYAGKMNFVNNTQQLKEQFKTSYFRPFIQGNVIWSSVNISIRV